MRAVCLRHGGGVNSVGVLVGMKKLGIRPNVIIFSDTGAEKPETYAYQSNVMPPWLYENNFPPMVSVQNNGQYRTLENNCLAKNMLPSLAYGFKSCSDKYKRRPSDQYLTLWMAAHPEFTKITKVLGYDAGEPHRVKDYADEKYDFWYPLVEWGWDRAECERQILAEGLPLPPKSSCYFCPASKKSEVIWLKDHHPDLFERAVSMERNAAATMTTIKGLGRHWSWEEIGRADNQQFKMFVETVPMPCFCADGDD